MDAHAPDKSEPDGDPNEYSNNHYVPVWYQKRFLPRDQQNRELFYLDLTPETFRDSRGKVHRANAVRRLGFKHCFAQKDLYTAVLRGRRSTAIEQRFFGNVDVRGRRAVDYFNSFAHPSVDRDAFMDLMLYMSSQKLRTPKGDASRFPWKFERRNDVSSVNCT